jgi:hypothetical protein
MISITPASIHSRFQLTLAESIDNAMFLWWGSEEKKAKMPSHHHSIAASSAGKPRKRKCPVSERLV